MEIEQLEAFKPLLSEPAKKLALVDTYQDKNGATKIKGNKHLKESQSYPIGYLSYKFGLSVRYLGPSCWNIKKGWSSDLRFCMWASFFGITIGKALMLIIVIRGKGPAWCEYPMPSIVRTDRSIQVG